MTMKPIYRCTLLVALLDAGMGRSQQVLPPPSPPPTYSGPSSDVRSMPPVSAEPAPAAAPQSSTLSQWIVGHRPECCGPMGGHGPIRSELFIRTGPSIVVAGGVLKDVLDHGYMIEAGGRSMFFDLPQLKAWTIDLSLSNTWNHGKRGDIRIPYDVVLPTVDPNNPLGQVNVTRTIPVSVREMNRTSGNLALGREWYLNAPANHDDVTWRAGADMLGRLGTLKLELHELSHRTDTYYGFGLAVHTDAELPYGCCTFQIGCRAEWGYNWINTFGPRNAQDLQDINLLVRFGVRF